MLNDISLETSSGSMQQYIENILGTNSVPSTEQRRFIQNALLEPEQDLQAIKEEITRVRTQLGALLEREQRLSEQIAPYKALISPFRRLPNDILSEIFLACLPTHNSTIDFRKAPLLLTHISSHTRQIALATPRLWAAIHIPIIRMEPFAANEYNHFGLDVCPTARATMSKRAEALKEWIRRSGACDLAVSLYEMGDVLPSDEVCKETFEAIISVSRCGSDLGQAAAGTFG